MSSEPRAIEAEWLVFEVSSELCGLPGPVVQEILHLPELSRPPGLPPFMEGFFNLAGAGVPVVRASRLFSLPDVACSLYTPLVLVRHRDGPLALLVDRVRDVRSFSEASSPVGERHSFNGCTAAQVVSEEGVVHLLALDRLLLEEETRRVAAFRDMEAERLSLLEGDDA